MDVCGDGDVVEVIELSPDEQPSNLNIGDVIEAISAADPEAAVALDVMAAPAPAPAPAPGEPYVRIVEQPASKALRFRYECEGRSAGSIPGVNSTSEHKTYPTIEVVGHSGKAIIVVSCVTRDEPYRPHPHNLVGRERCRHGVCTLRHDLADSARVSFTNLGIQCVKRRDVADALAVRESQRVDPFRTGFAHKNQPQSIDLNAVRLCFQVFLLNDAGQVTVTLRPVVSEVIYDKKAMSDLQILKISQPSGPVSGDTEVILLCEKVTREDINVVMCEEGPNGPIWEAKGDIILVHKQVAIAFKTPPYREPDIPRHVNVSIQLMRGSDGARSNSVEFQYVPKYQDSDYLKRKRQKPNPLGLLERMEQFQQAGGFMPQGDIAIKTEPSGGSPLHRYTPVDQPEMYQQQWAGEPMSVTGGAGGGSVAGGGGGGGYYGAAAGAAGGWATHSHGHAAYAQPMQIPQQSRSPLQSLQSLPPPSPGLHTMTPLHQQSMHTMPTAHHQMSPMHQQAMSPQGMHQQSMSPMHQSAMSPMHQSAMSPMHQSAMSPIHQQTQQRMSPLHQQGNLPMHAQSNQGMSLPNNQQNMSQLSQQAQPNQLKMSPILQPCNPQQGLHQQGGQAMSPLQQALSPAGGDTGRRGVSPALGHMGPHAGDVPMAVTQGQDMESSSSLSLNNLLNMDAGVPIQLNSGDLSNLSALLGQYRSNELSDSLNRLSTTDLLDPTQQ